MGKVAKCLPLIGVATATLLLAALLTMSSRNVTRAGGDVPIAALADMRPTAASETVELGRLLFSDPRLSRSGKTSCATCHDLSRNGASGVRIDEGDDGRPLRFNTPTVFNAGRNYRLTWQGRTRSLTTVVKASLLRTQLTGSVDTAMERLRRDRTTATRFRRAFGREPGLDDAAVAIAAFVETLVTSEAPVDRWLRGEDALTASQRRGYARFKLLGCASCHQGINWGGNLFQTSGVYRPLTRESPSMLRVPSLRNVAVTAPYFHDGSAARLEEAVARMGHSQLGVALSRQDVRDITAFLEGLTGRYRGKSLTPADRAAR